MMGQILVPLAGTILSVLLLWASISDIRARIIPNSCNLAILLFAPLGWAAMGWQWWPDIAFVAAVAVAVFLIFWGLFAVGAIGGGDVKMIGPLLLWVAPGNIADTILIMAIAGGAISVGMLLWQRRAAAHRPAIAGASDNGAEMADAPAQEATKPEVPYGLAIAIAGWWVVYQQYFNHFLSFPS